MAGPSRLGEEEKGVSKDRGRGPDGGLTPRLWDVLLQLAELGALHARILVSTIALAADLGVSQQTASRRLIELDAAGYIERQASFQGNHVTLTERGRTALEDTYHTLRRVFEERPPTLTFEGKVVTGMGEGAYYMSRKVYREQFRQKLGFNPFPGTLNLRLTPAQAGVRRELETYPAITIKGFSRDQRSFGDVKCFPVIINDRVDGAVALINRTHHSDLVLEVIAPVHLRSELGLSEGSDVKITLKTPREARRQRA
jgi:riboflavin kinase